MFTPKPEDAPKTDPGLEVIRLNFQRLPEQAFGLAKLGSPRRDVEPDVRGDTGTLHRLLDAGFRQGLMKAAGKKQKIGIVWKQTEGPGEMRGRQLPERAEVRGRRAVPMADEVVARRGRNDSIEQRPRKLPVPDVDGQSLRAAVGHQQSELL